MSHESAGGRDSTHPVHDSEVEPEVEVESGAKVEPEAEVQHTRTWPPLDNEDPTPPPPRPSLSDQTKPPVLRKIPAPGPVKVARALWMLSFVLGAAAVFIAFLSGDTLRFELTEILSRLAPGYDADAVTSLVDLIYWASLGGLGLIIAIEAVLLAFLMNRRGGARWVQLPMLVLHAGGVLVASAFLGIGDWGVVIELLLVAGFVVAFAGWILCLFQRAHRWFRIKDQAEPAALD
jgi:hypothetical protein